MPAAELASIDVEGSEVLGLVAEQIGERIRAAADWPTRFGVLDQVLTSRLADPPIEPGVASGTNDEVGHAWRRLVASGGHCPVSELAAETGWSDRHLRSRFSAETGITPKAAARVIRFDRTRRLLQCRTAAGSPLLLADLAADCGYYDQAHLAREFRDLAGLPPSRWLAEEFRNVQAQPAGALEALLA
jgi:transcriptional regulator GlxA family with amidase domain